MIVVVKPPYESKLDMLDVCGKLLALFPGSIITEPDCFAAEQQNLAAKQLALESQGITTDEYQLLLSSAKAKELRSGPGKAVSIPIGSECFLRGMLCAGWIDLRGECHLPNPEFERLVRFLESLDIGPVSIYRDV